LNVPAKLHKYFLLAADTSVSRTYNVWLHSVHLLLGILKSCRSLSFGELEDDVGQHCMCFVIRQFTPNRVSAMIMSAFSRHCWQNWSIVG